MHDLAEQSRSPILNHQSHLCTHKHPPGGYNSPHPFPSHIILHFKDQQDCRRHEEEEEEEEEVPMDYHHLTCTACLLALLPMLHGARNKETKKQCMVVEDTIHHSRNGWGWGKEGRKEGRKEEYEGTRGVNVKQICSWEQSRLHHRQASGPSESTESPLVPYPNPKP